MSTTPTNQPPASTPPAGNPTPTDPPTTPPVTDPVTPPTAPPPPAQEPDWKVEARKWEQRAKENSDAAARLAEFEEAQKTQQQRDAEALAESQRKVAEYELRDQIAVWAGEVAEATGVPAAALRGSTKEDLEAHAATLKPLIGTPATPPTPGDPPVPTIGQTPPPPGNTPLKDQIAAAEAAGNKELVSVLKAQQLGAPT